MTFQWQPCGYGCGERWRPFAGTKLKGHARCALGEVREQFAQRNAWRNEHGIGLSERQLAVEFGVNVGIVRAWRAVVEGWHR